VLNVYVKFGTRTRILIKAEDKVLVVKSWLGTGKWSLPGGGLHRGEDPITGVIRETREETGLTLSPEVIKHLGRKRMHDNGIGFTAENFKAELREAVNPAVDGIEIIEAKWIEPEKLNRKNASKDLLQLLGV
jgi:8-oxo-dGTP pyrophosphatase MutT (NUDIX family)